MSSRRLLEVSSLWERPLGREATAEILSAACEAAEPELSDFDPLDHLLRKEIKRWAMYQAPPVEEKQKLLWAAAHQHETVDADLPAAQHRADDELRCVQARGHEMLTNYLVLSTQYMHVRLVA